MRYFSKISIIIIIFVCSSLYSAVFASDFKNTPNNSPVISFFNPTGMNGFIVYDVEPGENQSGMSYGSHSFNLSSRLGLPVTVEVEGLSVSDGSNDLNKILHDSESNYLEIFSIQHALNYASKSSLSSFNTGSTDITMVLASANYHATDRFFAKLTTGVSKAMKENSGSESTVAYELDIAGLYEIAPGLTFSVGAGYSTNTEFLNDFTPSQDEKRNWSLNSKLRLKF